MFLIKVGFYLQVSRRYNPEDNILQIIMSVQFYDTW